MLRIVTLVLLAFAPQLSLSEPLKGYISSGGVIGIQVKNSVIKRVHIDSPAAKAGLLKGDVIIGKDSKGVYIIERRVCTVTHDPAASCRFGIAHQKKNEITTAFIYEIELRSPEEVLPDIKDLEDWE